MKKRNLSKSKIMAGVQCAKRLYLEIHRPDLIEVSTAQQAIFDTGHKVGEIAQAILPRRNDGVLVGHDKNLSKAIEQTT